MERMNVFTNKGARQLFFAVAFVMGSFLLLSAVILWCTDGTVPLSFLFLFLLTAAGVLASCYVYLYRQNKIIQNAAEQVKQFLAGNTSARIACEDEGELYKLFHGVNTLAAVLNAHAKQEVRAKEFLKDTISDISHQLKTPLAALNIYNGLIQGEAEELPEVKEFAALSEKELDRMETLVQSLLKITRLDAGSIVLEKTEQSIADMIREIGMHFAYRAKQEQKEIIISGADQITFFCDHDWMVEAISNVVKNALDHMKANGQVTIAWNQRSTLTQIIIKDNGSGIHPEDIHHIFKRFYRSRFSKDTEGVGLGLPLAKGIIEAHQGTMTVDSILGQGSTFTIQFLNPTKL